MIETITDSKVLTCIYCKSTQVIRHGKTSTGNKRYRCRECGKTWVLEKKEIKRPDVSVLVEEYLQGKTCRDLVEMFHSSPLRVNQKVREYLEGVPLWEKYLDTISENKNFRLVYLVGKSFACACKGTSNNTMFLALAVDSLSNVVLGFQIGKKDSINTWQILLERLKKRKFKPVTFMTNGSKHIEEAAQSVYPDASLRIFYHKAYRDKELTCCLSRFTINNKLVNDAIKAYDIVQNHNLNSYLVLHYGKHLKDFVVKKPEIFSKRLRQRLENKGKIRIDGLLNAFQFRFEKFHMLKGDPIPVINGWIAREMTKDIYNGFSRLSLLLQVPSRIDFKGFACGELPEKVDLAENCRELDDFIAEIAARAIHIPIFYSRCEMKIDKCSLI
jgi:transposase-like protein